MDQEDGRVSQWYATKLEWRGRTRVAIIGKKLGGGKKQGGSVL